MPMLMSDEKPRSNIKVTMTPTDIACMLTFIKPFNTNPKLEAKKIARLSITRSGGNSGWFFRTYHIQK